MSPRLIRCDLSLPNYFTYPPAPGVETRPMIPRKEARALYMRGEFGTKPNGELRPIVAHNTTHLDVPYHFLDAGDDLAAVLNRDDLPADRPSLARVLWLGGRPDLPGAHTREGVTYCEAISAERLPPVDDLAAYESLVVLTGFGGVMAQPREGQFVPDTDGSYHIPYLSDDAVDVILQAGIRLVALDSTTVEAQTQVDPIRFGSDVHFRLLGNARPVLIVEGLGGGALSEQMGMQPPEALLHVIPRRVNAVGAEAAHSRAFLYVYRDDPDGSALRQLQRTLHAEELYG